MTDTEQLPRLSQYLQDFVATTSDEKLVPNTSMSEREYTFFTLINELPTHGPHLTPRYTPRYSDFGRGTCIDAIYQRHTPYIPRQDLPRFPKLARYNYNLYHHERNQIIHRLGRLSAESFIQLSKRLNRFIFKPSADDCALSRFCVEYVSRETPPWLMMVPCNIQLAEKDLRAWLDDKALIDTYVDACQEYEGADALVLVLRKGPTIYALHDTVLLATTPGADCAIRREGNGGLILQRFDRFIDSAKEWGWWVDVPTE